MQAFVHYGYVSNLQINYKKIRGIEFVSLLLYIDLSLEKIVPSLG